MILTNYLPWVVGLLMVYTVFLIANDNRTKHETVTPLIQVVVWSWILVGFGQLVFWVGERVISLL